VDGAAPVVGILGGVIAFSGSQAKGASSAPSRRSPGDLTAGFSMFPFIMPSSLDPRSASRSGTRRPARRSKSCSWPSSSSCRSCLRTPWAYRIMRGKVTVDALDDKRNTMY
jgi:cytochrome d ubiquinol oxidase subunit II